MRRELIEGLDLAIVLRDLLVVDWVAPHGPWDDQIAFVFDGGTLDQVRPTGYALATTSCPRSRS